MEPPGRRYLCAGCRTAVLLCSRCDRGQRYCTAGCAERARRQSLLAAGRRYQATLPGRLAHAERQRRYRARQAKVTHQGSPPAAPSVPLATEPTAPKSAPPPGHCRRCQRPLPEWVRQDFLRRRIRRPSSDRRLHPHGPIP